MYNYISQDKPNRTRQPELDLSKFIAIFLMIACHCGIHFFKYDTVAFYVFDMLGGEFGAPVFMACMGIGIVFSHHNQPELLIKRGFHILILGYVLNFVRATLPELLIRLALPGQSFFSLAVSFYMVDILQFAGLSMVLLGLFKKWKVEPVYQLLIGILMAGLGDVLAFVSTGYEALDAVCCLLWGANEYSYFPLLNWFIYPAAGVFFGEILMHCDDKKALYKRMLPIGLAGVLLAYYLMFTDPDYYTGGSYYFMGIKNVVYGLCFPMFSFSLCYFVTEKTKIGDSRFVLFSSKNLNTLYCISWVLILWVKYFAVLLCGVKVTGVIFAIIMIAVFLATYGLCWLWQNIKQKRAARKKAE